MLKVLFPWKQNNTKKVLFAMEQVVNGAGPSADEQPPDELPLLPCHVCNRTFLPKPLKKHIPICEQTARRKRKPFDSLKQRVEGTDMAPFYQKSYLKKSNPELSSQAQAGDVYGNNKQSKWREKHVELQNTIKNAKGTKSDMNTNLPSNHTSITPNRKVGHLTVNQTSSNERCPICDRSFGPKAFDRHVEFCKEQKNRVQVHKSPAVVQQAKERLEARINYRVPPLRQSKRNLIRDKYSPSSQTNLLHRSNTIVSGKSTTSLASSVTTMLPNRRQPVNNNEKIIERNNKKDLGSKIRVDRAIGDCGDTKQAMKNDNNGNKSFHTKRTIPAKKINKTEINDGLQGLTVSSLCVEKNKKLVTWKDTVKAQTKVTTSISLTTTSGSVKRRAETTPHEEEPRTLRDLDKVPSLGKVVRSKMLMEKLNKFVSKKNRSDVDLSDDIDLTIFEDACATKKTASKTENLGSDGMFNEEAEDFLELAQINEEGEFEDESPKKMDLESINARRKGVDFHEDGDTLDLTQDIENSVIGRENLIQLLNKEDNFLKKYELSSSTETSDHECDVKTVEEENNKDDSGEDAKTEDTSSLCLRLPLEGLESKVKLRNNDLDPDEKLKKNIKSFYDIMKTRRCNAAKRREQLRLLESSKAIQFDLDSSPEKNTLKKDSLTSSNTEINVVEKFEENDVGEKTVRELVTNVETEELAVEAIPDNTGGSERNIDAIVDTGPDDKATLKIVSRKSKTWKRRKKLKKCRMCIKCFIRNGIHRILGRKNRVSGNGKMGLLSDHDTSENETVFDSPQILQEESAEELSKTPTILVDLIFRKSRSADCIATEQSLSISERRYMALQSENGFRSLPNISLHELSYQKKFVDYDLPAENSFDNIIPRKRRKISPSYLNLTSEDEREVEKNLKNNISKIRKRKKEEEPPLILNYEKIYTGGSQFSAADILYVNEVFTCSVTPERSELESVNDFEDDGIQEYGDEELEEWEAAEEELRKELERNKMTTRCESPTKLLDSVDVDGENGIENGQSVSEINRSESLNTLKNSSACTIVNIPYEKSESAKSLAFPTLGKFSGSTIRMTSHEIEQNPTKFPALDITTKDDKIPCRLPRIIPQNKHPIPSRSVKESMGDSFKLPPIGKDGLMKDISVEVSMPSDKMVQVPSRNDKESFSQQTGQLMVDNSSSFNRRDLIDNMENRLSSTKTTNTVNYDPFEQAHLQLMELIEDDHQTPSPTYSTTMSTHSTPNVEFRPFVTTSSTPKTAVAKSDGKRASVIDPPYSFQDNRASRDLDKEFELLESLVNNNLESEPNERSSLRCKDFGDDVDAIDPNLINEQDNLFIPEHLPSDDNSPGFGRNVKRDREPRRAAEPRLSRRPTRLAVKPTTRALPLIGPDQVRLAPDGSSAESQAGEGRRASPRSYLTNKTKSKMKIDFSPESLKNKSSRMIGTGSLSKQTGLEFGKVRAEGLDEITPREETVNLNRTPTAEELYPDNPAMYEEFRKYEEMYRREKEGKSSSSKKQRKKTADFGINIEDASKTYEDSTYGRKQQMEEQEVDQVEELVRNMLPTATTPGERLPKYCHECGNKYPVATAKFCVECGIKRLVL